MKFAVGDEVMIKKNNDHNYKRFSGKKAFIITHSPIFSRYIISIDNHIIWIQEKYLISELQYFMEEMTNEVCCR